MVMWKSFNGGKTWRRYKTLTRNSPRNHGYARRPQNFNNGFYAFWADGNPDKESVSYLYFCNSEGDVYRMPYHMTQDWQKPELVRKAER